MSEMLLFQTPPPEAWHTPAAQQTSSSCCIALFENSLIVSTLATRGMDSRLEITFAGEAVPEALFSLSKLKLATSKSRALREGMKRSICVNVWSQTLHTCRY